MTKEEAAIVAAYTGIMIGSFDDMHKYIEGIMERPVWTHEMASKEITSQIKERSKTDFMNIRIEG